MYRFHRRKHSFKAGHQILQSGGVDGHAWAGKYADSLRVCQVEERSLSFLNYLVGTAC